jgi:hypothetical protein
MAENMRPYIWLQKWAWSWGRHGSIFFDEDAILEDHVSNGRAASVRAVLPTGV